MSDHQNGVGSAAGKDTVPKPPMHGHEKSDGSTVPKKRPNKAGPQAAEDAEGKDPAEGNPLQHNALRTQSRELGAQSGLERIRLAAKRNRETRFTALLHHVDIERLRAAYWALNRAAAPGIDRVTWEDYGLDLEVHLQDLHGRIHRGSYRAKASRRAYIPKPDAGRRPLGIASLEDKIVQRAVAEVLGTIYEVDFLGFSYGFRPGRRAHDALDALAYGITRRKVNWVLDADIRGYFDAIPHERLMEFMEHRIGDPRMLRLLRKWLSAGILEDGALKTTEQGSPQGASISPLLANVYLHYVFDTWAHAWRRQHARGEVILVRYADDLVAGFQYRDDAERFLAALRERFGAHGLELHPDKTRLIEFGRFARSNRQRRGDKGSPETFDFLGFTHVSGTTRKGTFLLRRRTIASRFRRTLQRIRMELFHRMHWKVDHVGKWLCAVLTGYSNYFAVPTNMHRIRALRTQVARMWLRICRKRSQKDRTTWKDMQVLVEAWLPRPRYTHPWPEARMQARLT